MGGTAVTGHGNSKVQLAYAAWTPSLETANVPVEAQVLLLGVVLPIHFSPLLPRNTHQSVVLYPFL